MADTTESFIIFFIIVTPQFKFFNTWFLRAPIGDGGVSFPLSSPGRPHFLRGLLLLVCLCIPPLGFQYRFLPAQQELLLCLHCSIQAFPMKPLCIKIDIFLHFLQKRQGARGTSPRAPCVKHENQYIPPICGAAAGAGVSSLMSETTASVVNTVAAMLAAFCKALRVTLVGSTIPTSTISA